MRAGGCEIPIIVEIGQVIKTDHVALLVAVGANAVFPYLAMELSESMKAGAVPDLDARAVRLRRGAGSVSLHRRGLEHPGHVDHRRGDDDSGDRHQGVGTLQQRHRRRQARGGAAVHRLLRAVREHRQLAPVRPARAGARPLRIFGRDARRGPGLLRLHRVRRRLHRRAGSQEPPARFADWNPRLAGHLHHPLRGGVADSDRHRPLYAARRAASDRRRRRGDGPALVW